MVRSSPRSDPSGLSAIWRFTIALSIAALTADMLKPAALHRQELYEGLRRLRHFLLNEHKAPELVREPVIVGDRAVIHGGPQESEPLELPWPSVVLRPSSVLKFQPCPRAPAPTPDAVGTPNNLLAKFLPPSPRSPPCTPPTRPTRSSPRNSSPQMPRCSIACASLAPYPTDAQHVEKCTARSASMMRESRGALGQLLRLQAAREADAG